MSKRQPFGFDMGFLSEDISGIHKIAFSQGKDSNNDNGSDDSNNFFGALVHRRISGRSRMFRELSLRLSLPSLIDLPASKEIFTLLPMITTVQASFVNTALNSFKSNVEFGPKDSIHNESAMIQKRMRSHFSLTSKRDFTSAVVTSLIDERNVQYVWHMNKVFEVLLDTIRGIDSSFFSPHLLWKLEHSTVIEGISVSCSQTFFRSMREVYLIRKILDCAKDTFINQGIDPTHTALGAALTDLLNIIDTSIHVLKTKEPRSENNSYKSLCIFTQLTSNHRSMLQQLLLAIYPLVLSKDPEKFFQFLQSEFSLLTDPNTWLRFSKVGWDLLNNIFSKLEDQKLLVPCNDFCILNALKPEMKLGAREFKLSNHFMTMICLSYLLRKISVPLLRDFQQLLYLFHSSQSICSIDGFVVESLNSQSVYAINSFIDGDCVVDSLVVYSLWAECRMRWLDPNMMDRELLLALSNEKEYLRLPLCWDDIVQLKVLSKLAESRLEVSRQETFRIIKRWCIGPVLDYTKPSSIPLDPVLKSVTLRSPLPFFIKTDESKPDNAKKAVISLDTDSSMIITSAIPFKVSQRSIIDAKNRVLKKYEVKMKEVERRQLISRWRQERIQSLHVKRMALDLQRYEEDTEWKNEKFIITTPSPEILQLSPEGDLDVRTEGGGREEVVEEDEEVVEEDEEGGGEAEEEEQRQQQGGESDVTSSTSTELAALQQEHLDDSQLHEDIHFQHLGQRTLFERHDYPPLKGEDAALVTTVTETAAPASDVTGLFVGLEVNDREEARVIDVHPPSSRLNDSLDAMPTVDDREKNFTSSNVAATEPDDLHCKQVLLSSLRKEEALLDIDFSFTESEDIYYDIMSSLSKAMWAISANYSLACSDETTKQIYESDVSVQSINNLSKIYLLPVMRFQCEFLDQTVLFNCIDKYGALDHLDCINHIFLLSPRSQFMTTFGSCLVDECFSGDLIETRSLSLYKESGPFSVALMKTKTQCSFSAIKHSEYIDISHSEGENVDNIIDLPFLKLMYHPPYPLDSIFRKPHLNSIVCVSCRLLRLSILQAKIRHLWKLTRKLSSDNFLVSREFFAISHEVRRIIQALFDFSSDRISTLQTVFKRTLLENFKEGLSCLHNCVESYAYNLKSYMLVSDGGTSATEITVSLVMTDLINSCESCMNSLFVFLSRQPADFSNVRDSMTSLSKHLNQLRLIQHINLADRPHYETLLLFLDLGG